MVPARRPKFRLPAALRDVIGKAPASCPGIVRTRRRLRWPLWHSVAVRPKSNELAGAVEWLIAHRQGTVWNPEKAKGPALAALASFYGSGQAAEDRYRLIVTVNDEKVDTIDVVGSTEGKAIRVPRRFVKTSGPNNVKFDIEGRGQFGYAITLTGFTRDFGPDQDARGKPFDVHRRVYWADTPTFDGKPLAHGFSVARDAQTFENLVTQAPFGGKGSHLGRGTSPHSGQPAELGA